jgi:hypothetical protein
MSPKEDDSWRSYNDFHYFCDGSRMQKVFARHRLFLKTVELPGLIVDAGVFKGSSTLLFAHMIAAYSPNSRKKVLGFDTFDAKFEHAQGFELERAERFMSYHEKGMYEYLSEVIVRQNLQSYCELIKGDIVETLPAYVSDHPGMRISLLHLDLDIYKPTLEVLRSCYDLMDVGGLIILDQYGVEGWGDTRAIQEFFKERSIQPKIQLVPHTATPTAYIQL